MTNRMRAVTTVLAGTAAAFALAAGTAQAAPANSVFLYTGSSGHCATSGDNGVAGGVFASYTCQAGFAGYSLSVTAKSGSVSDVYINTFARQWYEVKTPPEVPLSPAPSHSARTASRATASR